jgi:putative SOS response-associated peptidase YedK
MCGRYTLIRLADFTDMFPWIRAPDDEPPLPAARYNIAPTQPVAVVPNSDEPKVEFFHWGFIPYWAKDRSIGNRMINARAETLAVKPVFKKALSRRRCLIPCSGFYEWKKNPDKTKTPMYIRMRSKKPFAFAGLWERWIAPDGSEVRSCTIITGKPNELVRSIHDRMPVIVRPELYRQWLDPSELPPDQAERMLTPYPSEEMEAFAVSPRVNNPKVDSADCIESITAPAEPSDATPNKPSPTEPLERARATKSRRSGDEGGGLFA